MEITQEFNRSDRVSGTATAFMSNPFELDDQSISVIVTLDSPVDNTRRWIFWAVDNTVKISKSIVPGELSLQVDVFRVDDFTGLFDGEIPTAEQMIEATTSWLEEQSAFD